MSSSIAGASVGVPMIDWLSMNLRLLQPDGSLLFPAEVMERLRETHGRIIGVNKNGDVEWISAKWENIRSDSHQVIYRITDKLWIQGSPARVDGVNNVFGSADIIECWRKMVQFTARHLDVALPLIPSAWKVTRCDVTENYDLGSAETVSSALLLMKQSEGGHYQPSSDNGTIYFNKRSSLRAGKAYAKGPHLAMQVRKGQAQATPEEQELANRLLRLELKLGGQYWRERSPKPWYQWTAEQLANVHRAYFKPLLGNLKVKDMSDKALLDRVVRSAPTKGQGRAAWATYLNIKNSGYRQVQSFMNRRTFFHHKRILLEAGIPLSQLQGGVVIPLIRYKSVTVGEPVRSFEEMRKTA